MVKEDKPSWTEFVTDEDRDPFDEAAIAAAKAMTPEQHLAFMENLAPNNAYAKAFVARARKG